MKTNTKEEEITIDKLKFSSKMLTKKTLKMVNKDTNHDHHTLVNRLDNSNIKVDLEILGIQLMLEQMFNLHNKEIT